MATQNTVDDAEIARFSAMSAQWWDPRGEFSQLHRINPLRLAFIKEEACRRFGRELNAVDALAGLRILDIGCGGGILSEPVARMGGVVVGADASAEAIAAARHHAAGAGLAIDYRATTAEALAAAGERFDVVLAMEIVEHVPDVPAFVALCAGLVKPGGLLIVATINRTLKSFALAIVGAEYVLRWIPRGTHTWSKFVTPDELRDAFRDAGATPGRADGVVYDPFAGRWKRSTDTDVNFMIAADKA